jgi:hypothetical protein
VSGVVEFATIAWPGLLVLAGFVALIIHGAREHRRRHPRGRWRVRFEGPHGVLTAEHELTEQEARRVATLARDVVGEPLAQRWVRDYDQEQGRAPGGAPLPDLPDSAYPPGATLLNGEPW